MDFLHDKTAAILGYAFDQDLLPDFVKEASMPEQKEVEEDDDSITATVETSLLEGKDITLFVTIDDDTFDGYLKVPFFGKVKLKNGRKIG